MNFRMFYGSSLWAVLLSECEYMCMFMSVCVYMFEQFKILLNAKNINYILTNYLDFALYTYTFQHIMYE